ncbi:T9SS type A sorting domain-containing protein [Wocania ichthyoenteri]|uniref:T9SS type A sorting domain-containing protein n=1 Tax=Wocania ichthyoenteri TaxID=1230531 RepID=UPI00053EF8C8|nr:T9SS type A sorting domain-containing protein [Wocania ichthyoenteri]
MKKITFTLFGLLIVFGLSSSTSKIENTSIEAEYLRPPLLTIEAETGTLSGTADVFTGCGPASGDIVRLGGAQGVPDGLGTLTFNNVNVATAGTYTLNINHMYKNVDTKHRLTINGTPEIITLAATAGWCYNGAPPEDQKMLITLVAGDNTIAIEADPTDPDLGTAGAFIDLISLEEGDTLGVDTFEKNNDVLIYPTLVDNTMKIKSALNLTGLYISDMSGRTVKTFSAKGQKEYNLETLSSGIYFANIVVDSKRSVHKFIKK